MLQDIISIPLIKLEEISLNFSSKEILKNINCTINANSITTIVGPNGGGKSSLLKVSLKLITPSSGKVWHRDDLVIGYTPQKLFISQNIPLTVFQFIALKPKSNKQAISKVLQLCGIEHLANSPVQSVSGGELQRVLLARALLNDPHLLVLDEPMQGVDIKGQQELYKLLDLVKQTYKCAILMVSHDLNIVMANTNQVLCVNKHICCAGTPEKISHDPSFINLFGKQFASNLALYVHNHQNCKDHNH